MEHILINSICEKKWENVIYMLGTEDGQRTATRLLGVEHPDGPIMFMWPIHLACLEDAPLNVIKAILNAYPEGIRQRSREAYPLLDGTIATKKDGLPIHWAAMGKVTSIDVIQFLIECYPEGLQRPNQIGLLPIHLAAWKNSSADIVNLLIECYPDGLRTKGKNEYETLPIHQAAAWNPSLEIMNLLIQNFPGGLKKADSDGRVALHAAAQQNPSDEIVKLLIESYPKGTRQKDSRGKLPIHYACVPYDQIDIGVQTKKTKVLLYYDPESIIIPRPSPRRRGLLFCKEVSLFLGKLKSSSEMVQLLDSYEKKFFTTLAREAIDAACSRNHQAGNLRESDKIGFFSNFGCTFLFCPY